MYDTPDYIVEEVYDSIRTIKTSKFFDEFFSIVDIDSDDNLKNIANEVYKADWEHRFGDTEDKLNLLYLESMKFKKNTENF